MNIVIFGSTNFTYKCFKAVQDYHKVNGVVCTKNEIKISYNKRKIKISNYFDFKRIKSKKVKLIQLDKFNKIKVLEFLERLNPEIILVLGWYYIIPKTYLKRFNFFGIHASLLQSNKGGAPLVWSILKNEKKTGITLFKFSSKIDDGDIVSQKSFKLSAKETIKSAYKKSEKISLEVLMKFLKNYKIKKKIIFKDKIYPTSYNPQRKPSDGKINWKWTSSYIERFIRAQTKPYPGAYTYINKKKFYIFKGREVKKVNKIFHYKRNVYKKNNFYYFKCKDYFIKAIN